MGRSPGSPPLRSFLRPHRGLVVPLLAVASPLLWFVGRQATARYRYPHAGSPRPAAYAVAVAAALFCGYVLAALAAATLARRTGGHPLAGVLFRPSDATLLAFAALVVLTAGYAAASAAVTVPPVVDRAASAAGIALGLPLVVLYGVLVVASAPLGRPPGWLEWTAVGLGVALTVVWVAVLAAALSRVAGRPATAPGGTDRGAPPKD